MEETLKEMDSLKAEHKEALTDEERDKIKSRTERLEARREQIDKLIQKMSENRESQER